MLALIVVARHGRRFELVFEVRPVLDDQCGAMNLHQFFPLNLAKSCVTIPQDAPIISALFHK
jgi:hypothetical protein